MDDLTTLLHEAVENVEPTDRLTELRARTCRPSRGRWYVVGAAGLATAVAVTAIALLGNQRAPKADDNGPVASPSSDASPTAGDSAYPVYYIGETPAGPRLYREFQRAPGFMWTEVAIQLLTRAPRDPDYRTTWPTGAFETAKLSDGSGVIEVTLMDGGLRERPAGMSAAEAELAVQQIIYTLQGTAGQRFPVQFRWNGNPIDQVLGVPTSEPIVDAPQLDVLAMVSISAPDEGRVVKDSFSANGVASSFEATVPWQLRDSNGEVVLSGSAQAEGWMDKLYPWETGPIDVSGLSPGSYTFVAMTDDPSGGVEGDGPTFDTRSITIP